VSPSIRIQTIAGPGHGAPVRSESTAFFVEAGYRHGWLEPLAYLEYLRGGDNTLELIAPHVGCNFWLIQHNFNMKLDVGYRYSHINGGRMFEYAAGAGGTTGAGPGFDHGINVHEVRGGLRYQFGGQSDCAPPPEPYVPEPEPIYTK